jgi:hypothetical protein
MKTDEMKNSVFEMLNEYFQNENNFSINCYQEILGQLGMMNNYLECLMQYQKQSVVEVLHSPSEEMKKTPELLEIQHLNEHFQSIMFQLKNVLERLSENAAIECFLPRNEDAMKFIDARISLFLQTQLKEAMSEVECFKEKTRIMNENEMTILVERIQEANRNMLEDLIRKLPCQNGNDSEIDFYLNQDDENDEQPPSDHETDNNGDNHTDERDKNIRDNRHGEEEEDDPDPPGGSQNDQLSVEKIIDALLEAEDDVHLETLLKQIGVRFF